MDATTARALIADGETLSTEFKSEARQKYSDKDVVEAVACLANGAGGTLFLGVEDDGTVTGAKPRHGSETDAARLQALIANRTIPPLSSTVTSIDLDGDLVTTIEVDSAPTPVGTTDGTYKRRALQVDGKPQCVPYPLHEMLSRQTSAGQSDYAQLQVSGATWDDLDPEEFARLRRLLRRSTSAVDSALAELDDVEIARALGVIAVGENPPQPLMGALLLFGRADALRRLVPTHEALFQVTAGTRQLVNDTLVGGLFYLAEELFNRFEARNIETEIDQGLLRIGIPLVPAQAAREAIANALVHRDFTRMGAVRVELAEDALTVANPGGFPDGIRLDNLLDESRPRSRTLSEAFKRAGVVERAGRGIPRMIEWTLRIGREAPDFSRSSADSVVAVFPIDQADTELATFIAQREARTGHALRLAELQVIHTLRRTGSISLDEAAALTQRTTTQARSTLARMIDEGLVEGRGTGRGRAYHLSPEVYRELGGSSTYVRVRGIDPVRQREMIRTFVGAHGSITRSQAAELCSLTPAQASAVLRSLVSDGELELRGERRGSHYVLAAH